MKIIALVKSINKAVLAVIAIVAVVVGVTAFAAGYSNKPHPRSMPTSTSSIARTRDLGGVDLAGYCESYNFDSGSTGYCLSNIDLAKACNWQYGENRLTFKFRSSDPLSAACYRAGDSLGGIKDMQGYCENIFKASTDIEATVDHGRTWVCRTAIDMKLVCTWQYQKRDIVARKDDKGNWHCYD